MDVKKVPSGSQSLFWNLPDCTFVIRFNNQDRKVPKREECELNVIQFLNHFDMRDPAKGE